MMLAFPWGTRHPISPELAETDVLMILLLLPLQCAGERGGERGLAGHDLTVRQPGGLHRAHSGRLL